MRRTAWLALICLISLGGLFALRSNIGAHPIHDEAAVGVAAPSPDLMIDDRPPPAKADRLPSPYFDKIAAKPAGAVKPVPAERDPVITPKASMAGDVTPPARSGASEVTTWHWHAGSKITKRTTTVPPQ
jgi:hypothetical protein